MIFPSDVPVGYTCLFDGNGGVAPVSDLSDLSDLSDKLRAPLYPPGSCCAAVWLGSGADLLQGVIIAIGAPITQSHNSHNSHNSHIKRRPIDFANRSGYTEFECKKLPQGYAGLFYGNGGAMPLFGMARAQIYCRGCARLFMATAVCCLRWRGAC